MNNKLLTGVNLKVFYSSDVGNSSPSSSLLKQVNEIAEFPAVAIQNQAEKIETYDSDYTSVLMGDKSIEAFPITVNLIPDDISHQYLTQAAKNQSALQVKVQYEEAEDQEAFILLNGYISSYSDSGDKDSAVTRSFIFAPETLVAQGIADVQPVLRQGDFGVGSNGVDIPQYQLPMAGNGFIQIPGTSSENPASANLIGVGLTNQGRESGFVISESGDLKLYARNASTAWTRIYSSTEADSRYARLNEDVTFKAVTGTSFSTNPISNAWATVNNDAGQALLWRNTTSTGKANESIGINASGEVVFTKANDLTSNTSTTYRVYHEGFKPTKVDVGLGNVLNSAQLTVANNLSDLANKATSRTNLGLGNVATLNIGTSAGNVVTVGDYGIAPFVAASTGTDLNTLNTTSLCTVVTNPVNAPAGTTGTWFLQVMTWNSGGTPPTGYRCTQILYGYGASGSLSGRNYTRSYVGADTWTSWNKVVAEDTQNVFTALNTFNATTRVNGNIEVDNGKTISFKNTSGTNLGVVTLSNSNTVGIGSTAVPISINSSTNPTVRVGATNYTMYHTGNKPTADDVGLGSTSTPTFAGVNVTNTSDGIINLNGMKFRSTATSVGVISTPNQAINIRPKGDTDTTQTVIINPATSNVSLNGMSFTVSGVGAFNAGINALKTVTIAPSSGQNTEWATVGFFDSSDTGASQRGALFSDKAGATGLMNRAGKTVAYGNDGTFNISDGELRVGADRGNNGEANDARDKGWFSNKGWLNSNGVNAYQEGGNGQWIRQINGMRLLSQGTDIVSHEYLIQRTGSGNAGHVINVSGGGSTGTLELRNNANLYLGGTNPTFYLGGAGMYGDGNLSGTSWSNPSNAYLKTWLGLNGVSDIRMKEDFLPCEGYALDKVNKIEFVQFDWNDANKPFKNSDHVEFGWKAQQLEEIDPGLITKQYGESILNPDLSTILPLAFKAIQELNDENKALVSRIEKLENAIQQLLNK
ncbi:pyocin knob domain-containing S74 family peptidase [Serratia liquefaciens]|uniref:pyocin knob domain-containing S74 family peptidase n=1 Tax=Serratia liquefaciens TaxID=614 RepID=UPI00217AB4BC|nr:pyocin knob domain-containing S74 family peptidase [Serratia liquefaciens]CAI2038344.1 Uncharacterised protein [Serratia liquefaciens]